MSFWGYSKILPIVRDLWSDWAFALADQSLHCEFLGVFKDPTYSARSMIRLGVRLG